jgi:hypothetical protein
MVLTLDGRVFNQIIVAQLLRMNEHRPRYLDLVIKCERTNELWGALPMPASRCASFARALTSISAESRRSTSSNSDICSYE